MENAIITRLNREYIFERNICNWERENEKNNHIYEELAIY